MLRSLPIRLALLVFEAVWLGVIVPGHQRGAVLTPGATSCCCCHCSALPSTPGHPTQQQKDQCAICSFFAHLILPPVVDFHLDRLCLAQRLPIHAPETFQSVFLQRTPPCRGPPALAA
jgi:hypothetical protein